MKKFIVTIVLCLSLIVPAIGYTCDCSCPAGPQGPQGPKGDKGDSGYVYVIPTPEISKCDTFYGSEWRLLWPDGSNNVHLVKFSSTVMVDDVSNGATWTLLDHIITVAEHGIGLMTLDCEHMQLNYDGYVYHLFRIE